MTVLAMIGLSYNEQVVLLGVSLLGAAAGVIGCFAVLRRRALTGDALAHAALPGLALAFMVTGQRSLPVLLLGAAGSGVLGIAVMAWLRRGTRLKEDAALGIVLAVFTGVGTVLMSVIQRRPEGNRAGLDAFIFGKTAGMIFADLVLVAGLAGLTVIVVALCYKEFKLAAFDADFARVQGWPAFALDFLLMLLVVIAVVIGLPAVGVLLMAALLVIPGAAARFWTDRLGVMLVLSGVFGAQAGVMGTLVTVYQVRVPTGPAIILAAGVIFLCSLLFAPRRGLLARAWQRRRLRTTLAPPAV
jgi:manganese/zinc/iron transport system permease protein